MYPQTSRARNIVEPPHKKFVHQPKQQQQKIIHELISTVRFGQNIFVFKSRYRNFYVYLCFWYIDLSIYFRQPQRLTEPSTEIIGAPDMYIESGSTINLTCVILNSPEPPAYIFWNHNNAVSIGAAHAAAHTMYIYVGCVIYLLRCWFGGYLLAHQARRV